MRSNLRRKIALSLGLLLGLFAFTFNAEALSWVNVVDFDNGGGSTDQNWFTAVAETGTGSIILTGYDPVLDMNFKINGAVIDSTGDVGRYSDIDAAGSTILACYSDLTNTDLKLAKSTDNGAFWSTSVINSTGGQRCAIHMVSEAIVYVAYANHAATSIDFVTSNNAGSTWSSTVNLNAATTAQVVQMAWANSTHGMVLFHASAAAKTVCRTSNSGANWTCANPGGTSTSAASIQHVVNETWVIAYESGASFNILKTTDGGVSWSESSSGLALPSSPTGVSIVVANATTWSVMTSDDNVGINTACCQQSNTTNAGASWSALDAIIAASGGGATDFGAGEGGGSDAILRSNGDLVFATPFRTSTTTVSHATAYRASFVPDESQGIDAAATFNVTQLMGIDVDITGSFVILRNQTAAGTTLIQTLAGSTLIEQAEETTTCFFADGVVSQGHHGLVAYTICNVNDPSHLRIRTPGLAEPSFSQCSDVFSGQSCPDDIEYTLGSSDFEDNDDFLHLLDVEAFPLDWSTHRPGREHQSGDGLTHYLSFAYTTDTGKIGVAFYSHAGHDATDRRNQASVGFGGGVINHMCAWTTSDSAGNSRQYVGAVDAGLTAKIYRVDFSFALEQTVNELHGALTLVRTLGASHTGATGIGCAADKVITRNSAGSVAMADLTFDASGGITAAPTIWTSSTNTTTGRGVAVSGDGRFASFMDNTTIHVRNATTGSSVATADGLSMDASCAGLAECPSMFMDHAGGSIWQSNTTRVAVFNVGEFTCGSACDVGPGEPPELPPGVTGGLFGGAGAAVGGNLGVGTFGGNLFLGAVLIGLVSMGAATAPAAVGERRVGFSWMGATIGAVLGFLMAWGFGFFNTAVVFAVVVLAGAGAFLMWRRSGG